MKSINKKCNICIQGISNMMLHEHGDMDGNLIADEELYVFQMDKNTDEKMMRAIRIILESIIDDVKNKRFDYTTYISVTKNDADTEKLKLISNPNKKELLIKI